MQLKATESLLTHTLQSSYSLWKKEKRHLYGNIILFVDLLLWYPPSAKAIESNKKCM